MISRKTKLLVALIAAVSAIAGSRLAAADYNVTVNLAAEKGTVSPEILGFNAVYSYESDAQWQGGGKIPELLREAGAKLIRYPGGTVVTFYHWKNPTVPGHVDSWAPNYDPARNKPASATMSLDEYLDFARANGITPLVGVNMGSGRKYNRVPDGIEEAQAMVRHCMEHGPRVTYYYLDNEPYARDANFTYTAEQYAEQVNLYAPALKAVDPGIKIIANLHPGVTKTEYTRTVVRLAGANIDVVDIHNYWNHGHATFAGWTAEAQMLHQGKWSYADERAVYRKMFAEEGHPELELAVLEWNIGPTTNGPEPTQSQAALMAGEQFMQYVQAGLKFSCFWPLDTDRGDPSRALLSSAHGYRPNKVHGMFRQFAGIGGQMQVTNAISAEAEPKRLANVSVRSVDGSKLWIFLLNKNQAKPDVTVDLDLAAFSNFNSASAVGFESTDDSAGPLAVHPVAVATAGKHVTLTMPKNSFAKVTISRPAR